MGDPSGASGKTVKSEIQPQQSGRDTVKLTDEEKEIEDEIFEAAMANKWTKVRALYKRYEFVHKSKLTRSEDTALHLAISSYHPDRDDSFQHTYLECIEQMITFIQQREDRQSILKQKNEKGNTPLHLAAEVGSVNIIECILEHKNKTLSHLGEIGSEDHLIWETNSKGETPLFIAASRGKLKAFLYLHKHCKYVIGEDRIKLCRRKDGDNILHAAICGEYIDVAFQIIHHYEKLADYRNVDGMTPLHFLSRMPRVFQSGNHFRFIDSIIYFCINVEKLEKMEYKRHEELNWKRKFPENYQTIVEFLELLWNGTVKTYGYLACSKGTTGEPNVNRMNSLQGHQSDRTNDIENPPIPDTTGITNEDADKKSPDEKKEKHKFPAKYIVLIELFKYLMKIVLLVLGIGLERMKKLGERKKRYTWAVQIMKLMIEKERKHKFYESAGEEPEKGLKRQLDAPPLAPPITDDDERQKGSTNTAAIKTDDPKSATSKETPLLVASKMGIVEMVRYILKIFPIAIQDTDSDEKNILLLAVEHRQTDVYNWLIGEKYPEYVFSQVDKHGNSAVHLAAMYQNLEAWRIPGSALQLQGERKWYKYVKHTLPTQSYFRYNNKGQTPRQIYGETHAKLLKDGTEWLITTANSCSVVAALIATVAFATSATIPGGTNDKGQPHLENQPAFDAFSIASVVSLCFSVTALVFFLAILTSRCQHNDFEKELPRKLLLGLTSLFASITAILVSFCAAHFFVLRDKFRTAAIPIYGATCIPVVFFAFNQFPLYVDLIRSYIQQLPLRSCKVFYTNSPETPSSDQKKEDNQEKLSRALHGILLQFFK